MMMKTKDLFVPVERNFQLVGVGKYDATFSDILFPLLAKFLQASLALIRDVDVAIDIHILTGIDSQVLSDVLVLPIHHIPDDGGDVALPAV
jgi:hypothetical protein